MGNIHIVDSHEFYEMYRGDKDFRLGIELCKDPDIRYTALVPDVASPADSKFFGTHNFPRKALPPLPDNFRIEYLKSRLIYFNRSNISLGGFFQFSSGYPGMIRKLRPDLIYENPYTTLTPRSYQTYFAARAGNIPTVYVDPGDIPPKGPVKRFLSKIEGPIVRNASHIIVYNDMGKERFIRDYGCPDSQISVIPKPVDLTLFTPGKGWVRTREEIDAGGRFVVSYFGRPSNNKGCRHLLEAARRFKEEGSSGDYLFLLVGGNIMEQDTIAIREMKEKNSLDNVVLTGKLPHSEMVRYQAASDLAVYPDLTNPPAFPTVLAESMAMGKAIIVGNKGFESATPIRHGANGVIVKAGDVDGLCNAIKELRADEKSRVRYGAEARSFAESSMGWEAAALRYRRIFEAAVEDNA